MMQTLCMQLSLVGVSSQDHSEFNSILLLIVMFFYRHVINYPSRAQTNVACTCTLQEQLNSEA